MAVFSSSTANQSKSQILFLKNGSTCELYIMTLDAAMHFRKQCSTNWHEYNYCVLWYLHGLVIKKYNFCFWMISWSAKIAFFGYLKKTKPCRWQMDENLSNLVKSHDLMCHFIRVYLFSLPPYLLEFQISLYDIQISSNFY